MAAQGHTDSGFLDVEGGRLYYEVSGEGKPLVLIHAGVADSTMWDEQMDALTERYRVIRYDTRGYGKTTTEAVSFSNRQDLYDLLKHLGVEKAHVLGISRGSMIATDFALEHPEMVSALVLCAPGVGGFQAENPPQEEIARFAKMDELWEAGKFDELAELEADVWATGFGRSAEEADPRVKERVFQMVRENYRTQTVEPAPQPLDPPAYGRLDEIKVPTLVIIGNHDTAGTRASADVLAERIPGAKKLVIEGTAHMINMEKPEEFTRAVLDFLEGVS
jgi:3-oxoadipate enol-lactonase